MHYLIDGHNLIGKMPDINLDDPYDEVKLILRLRSWAAGARSRRVTVIFDHGLPGGVDRGLSTSRLEVLFAASGQTADALLISRIKKAANPKIFTVVSSDRQILRQAELRRMHVLKAELFAERISRLAEQVPADPPDEAEPDLSDSEIQMWLNLFGASDEQP